jgi:hypothetical protein
MTTVKLYEFIWICGHSLLSWTCESLKISLFYMCHLLLTLNNSFSLRHLRFSKRCRWGFKAPAMWRRDVRSEIPDVSNNHIALISKGKYSSWTAFFEDEGDTVLRPVRNVSLNYTASHCWRLESPILYLVDTVDLFLSFQAWNKSDNFTQEH